MLVPAARVAQVLAALAATAGSVPAMIPMRTETLSSPVPSSDKLNRHPLRLLGATVPPVLLLAVAAMGEAAMERSAS